MNTEIMVPGHPRWAEFLNELSKAQCCNLTTEYAEATLRRMSGINPLTSLQALRELGGKCDCAILFDLVNMQDSRASA